MKCHQIAAYKQEINAKLHAQLSFILGEELGRSEREI